MLHLSYIILKYPPKGVGVLPSHKEYYKSRFVPRLAGKVIHVSADRFTDERSGEAYYLARVSINDGALAKLSKHVELYPGMPAEVFITTGESTLLQYLASPIIDSFRRSFKEE